MAIWFIRRIQGGYGGWSEKKKRIAAKSFGVDAEVSKCCQSLN
jgi:hypothetical protein